MKQEQIAQMLNDPEIRRIHAEVHGWTVGATFMEPSKRAEEKKPKVVDVDGTAYPIAWPLKKHLHS